MKSGPRIGIIGSGAIGGFYGLMLARAGFEVHFLLRSDYSAIVEKGFFLRSQVYGNFHLENVNAYRKASDMPTCDWLLIGAKSTSNAELPPLITRVAAPDAKIIVLQNGLGVEDQLRTMLPASLHLIGGLCFVATSRTAPGVIEHLAHGDVNLGYHSGPAATPDARQAIVEAGIKLFKTAEIKATPEPDLTLARWRKLVVNIPFNGLSVLLNAGTHQMLRNPESRKLLVDLMREVVNAAAKCGYTLSVALPNEVFSRLEAMPDDLPSMYFDYVQRRPMELDAIYGAPLVAALKAGFTMPKVEVLYQVLRFIEAHNTVSQDSWTHVWNGEIGASLEEKFRFC